MNINMIALGKLIKPAKLRRADDKNYPVLSMTMHSGLVDQSDKFKKRIASSSTSSYKVVTRKQLVVGFPIDEGVLSFQELYDAAIVSPAYDIWDICEAIELETPYLEKFLRCPETLHIYRSKLRGTTARRRTIPNDIFLSILVPLPPIAEQKRIAEILDRTQSLISKRKEAIAKLDTLTQSIFIEMFGDPVTNPKGWDINPLSKLTYEFRYGSSNKSQTTGKPALRIPNVCGGSLNLLDLKLVPVDASEFERLRLKNGDILFVRTNGNPDFVGRCAVFDYKLVAKTGFPEDEFIFASYLIRARINLNLIAPIFLREFLLGTSGRRELRSRCKTSAGQFNINIEGLGAISIPLPPLQLQKEFAQRVEAVEKLKARHRASLSQLQALFASLQHRAFRGEL